MAKLGKRLGQRVAYLTSLMALTTNQDERLALLAKVLDALAIDDAQRKESAFDAQQRVNRSTQKRLVKPANADPIDSMNHDELQRYIDELYTRRDALLTQREERSEPAPTPTPEPEKPAVTEAATYALPTVKMRKAIAAFDALTDAGQLDQLRGMWGEA